VTNPFPMTPPYEKGGQGGFSDAYHTFTEASLRIRVKNLSSRKTSSFTFSLPNKNTRFVLRAGQGLSFAFPTIIPPDGVIRIKTCSNMHTGGSV
jgi:hypothetical protein